MPINNFKIGPYKRPWCDSPDYPIQKKRMVPGYGYVYAPFYTITNSDSIEEKERKEKLKKKIEFQLRKEKLKRLNLFVV